ncbi:MAG: UDP-N-acetyl glucosamine 2-epimerase [Prevotella sp.]
MKNITMVAGARPNFIKLAPIVWACEKAKKEGQPIDYNLVYTGTENDMSIEQSLFDDLGIDKPQVYLGVDCESLNELTGQTMGAFDKYLDNTPTDVVIVVDDLASTMAVAIVCKKRGVKLAHLVAGTRSFDFNMPKEVNRLVIDGLSDLLFTAGAGASSIVSREGVELQNIYMVGNIIIDTLRHNYNRFIKPAILQEKGIGDGEYIVFTINRKALLKNKEYIQQLTEYIYNKVKGIAVVAPLRGMAKEVMEPYAKQMENFYITDSMGYLEFGYLTTHARGIITDSGNIAEEATFNNVPCITLNEYTEHIETVNQGTNVLVGYDLEKLATALEDMTENKWKKSSIPDRWDGRTAERILQTII